MTKSKTTMKTEPAQAAAATELHHTHQQQVLQVRKEEGKKQCGISKWPREDLNDAKALTASHSAGDVPR